MKLKRNIIILIMLIIGIMPLNAEYVFLKDGAIIEGSITSETAGTISLRTKEKKIKLIQRSDILRILYTDLYMGKIYVQKIDGKNVICYMVDEDRDTYTFRKELYIPDEFKLRRDQVLFMARGNPSGLEGEAGSEKIDLKWYPPYNPVKQYRIYLKGPGEKSFQIVGEIDSKNITLKELKSNTKYVFYVTALDASGDESLPSNELTITTKSIPPVKPVIKTVESLNSGVTKITWSESTDPDGKVAGYRVYKNLDGKISVLAETKPQTREYNLSKNEEFDRLYITAFDDLKTESEMSKGYPGRDPQTGFSILPSYIVPMGSLKNIAGNGYGISLKYEISNFYLEQLEFAAIISFYYLAGKDDFVEPTNKINSIMLLPVMLTAGYALYPFNDFAVIPLISAGAVISRTDYTYFDIPSSKKTNDSDIVADPSVGAGLSLRYNVTENVYVTLSAEYMMFFDKSESFTFITGSAGAGVRF